jgi:hypothetical protein
MHIFVYIYIIHIGVYVKSSKALKKSKSATFTINRCAGKLKYAPQALEAIVIKTFMHALVIIYFSG